MSTPDTGSINPGRVEQALRAQYRNSHPGSGNQSKARGAHTELLAEIDGIPILVRFLLADTPQEAPSDFASGDDDLRALLSTTVEKALERMGGSRLRRGDLAKQPLATVELIAIAEQVARHSALPPRTVLRVGPLELDLLDRTAARDGRQIDLRPREFQLLKHLMERSDTLLTRATLLKEVWRYKFVPESNLVDVHMSKLRRKIDGPNDFPLIRNVRDAGFILSTPHVPRASMSAAPEQTGHRTSASMTSALDRLLQC